MLIFPLVRGKALAASDASDTGPSISFTSEGVNWDWDLPEPVIETLSDGAAQVSIAGFDYDNRPGSVRLPYRSFLIAIPPDSQPSLSIFTQDFEEQALPAALAKNPEPGAADFARIASIDRDGLAGYTGKRLVEPSDTEPISLKVLGNMGDVRLARLTVRPVTIVDAGALQALTHLKVTVNFNAVAAATPEVQDPLVNQLRQEVINPLQVQARRDAGAPDSASLQALSQASSIKTDVAVEVTQNAIYKVTCDALLATGYSLGSFDVRYLHLTRAGADIPYEWSVSPQDATCNSGEYLQFYAVPRFNRYANYDVYFLGQGDTLAPSISTRSGAPGTTAGSAWAEKTAEENLIYMPDSSFGHMPAGRDGDRWVWSALQYPSGAEGSTSVKISLNIYPEVMKTATLTLWMIGYTDIPDVSPDHYINVYSESTGKTLSADKISWDGQTAYTATVTIPTGHLVSGTNTFRVSLNQKANVTVDGVWVDALKIRYALNGTTVGNYVKFQGESTSGSYAYPVTLSNLYDVTPYDVTDPDNPVRLTGFVKSGDVVKVGDGGLAQPRSYFVSNLTGFQTPTLRLTQSLACKNCSGGDYVMITHSSFASALAPLVALRKANGFSVIQEDVQAIYDTYGGGLPTPTAIRNYLANAYSTWLHRPYYVLLVGDGTSDPRHYLATSTDTYIPPYLEDVDPYAGETAADNRFVTVYGNDVLPDLMIGRLPVNSSAEAQVVVSKIANYETQVSQGNWTGNWMFVADNPDDGGDYAANMNVLISMPSEAKFNAHRIFYSEGAAVDSFHAAILDYWNHGAGIIAYNGHSSIYQWAAERLFHLDDLASLTNASHPAMLLELTCFTTSFQVPNHSTLDESLIRLSGGGAVAVWGSTGLGITRGELNLGYGFMKQVYEQGSTTAGLAAQAGKLRVLESSDEYLDLLDTFTLLGDPATPLKINFVPWNYSFVPSIFNQ